MDEEEIRFLLQIKTNLETHIQSLELDIEKLHNSVGVINLMISKGSFQTAESLLDTETFIKTKPDLQLDNLSYTRKIFAKNGAIIAFLRYEKNKVLMRFQKPSENGFTPEKYIHDFVQPILVPLKKIETELKASLTKIRVDKEEFIDTITLEHIVKFESFEFLVEKIQSYFVEI